MWENSLSSFLEIHKDKESLLWSVATRGRIPAAAPSSVQPHCRELLCCLSRSCEQPVLVTWEKLITDEEPEFFFFQVIFLCIHRSGTSMVTFKACFWSNSSSWAFRETFSLCLKPKHWKQTTEWERELGMTQFVYPRTRFVLDCVTPARCLPNLSQGGSSSDVGSLLPSWTHQQGERSPSWLMKSLLPRPISCGHSSLLFTHL